MKQKKMISIFFVTLFTVCFVWAFNMSSADESGIKSYMIISQTNKLPHGLSKIVKGFDGTVKNTIPEIGIAIASSSDPAFPYNVETIKGIRSVVPDLEVPWIIPDIQYMEANPPSIGNDEPYFGYQWGLDAIDAPEAWNTGARGTGVQVFVLDSGIDAEHPDLAPNLNTYLSTSFVPGEDWNVQPGVYFNHGTHVSGIIAAAHNSFGVIGVAPEAELVTVKVISEFTDTGAFSWIINGIVYAAAQGADIVNMSLGANFRRSGYWDPGTPSDKSDDVYYGARVVAELVKAQSRATTYAYQKGVTIVCSAGNCGGDGDHDADWIHLPSDLPNVLSISATAPYGWILDPTTNLDEPAHFTNFGQSVIDFAAPGGDYDFPSSLYVYDMVLSTSSESWYFAAGTSQAAPHVTGVAALIIEANGGKMHPAQVEVALRRSADDLGKPGKDDFFGHGRVNAYNVVK
jgi:subtilisin family serine protease